MTKLLRLSLTAAVAILLLAGVLHYRTLSAQTAVTSTTLAAAIVNPSDQNMLLTSVTNWTATSASGQTYAVIDREVVGLRSINTTTKLVGITRGLYGTRATGHASGATAYFIATGSPALTKFDRAGVCSTTAPVDTTQDGTVSPVFNLDTGQIFSCLNGQWQRSEMIVNGALGVPGSPGIIYSTAYTNATTTFSNVPGLSFPVRASASYSATCSINWSGSAATTGPKYTWTGPASPTGVTGSIFTTITATTFNVASLTAFGQTMANANTITSATTFNDQVRLSLVNGANSGTVQLQAAAVGAGTLTIIAGSSCTVQ